MSTIIGVFDDALAARRVMDELRASSLKIDDVSIVSRATESGEPIDNADDVSAGEGAAVGAVWGGLVGLAALLIPGVGPFIAFGALGAALTGAVTGAVVGGITAAIVDFSGVPEEEARRYETMVQEGRTLVAVKAHDEDSAEVRRILTSAGAESLRDGTTNNPTDAVHVAMYDEGGRRVDGDYERNEYENATREAGASDVQPVPGSQPLATPRGVYDYPEAGRPVIDSSSVVHPPIASPTVDPEILDSTGSPDRTRNPR